MKRGYPHNIWLSFMYMISVLSVSTAAIARNPFSIDKPAFIDDFKQLKNWKTDYFGKWLGSEDTKFLMTFPEVRSNGISKYYTGSWFNKFSGETKKKSVFISGDYEAIYYKFAGFDTDGNKNTYHYYNLRLNGQYKAFSDLNVYYLLRNGEIQQSNFYSNHAAATIASGYSFDYFKNEYGMHVMFYAGVSMRKNITGFFPGIEEEVKTVEGMATTSGVELRFSGQSITGYIRHQFSLLHTENIFSKTTVRLSYFKLFFTNDSIWFQLDFQFNQDAAIGNGNMVFLHYAYKF
ncbi:MAG: hypothetical protein JXR95_13020 [Deltaproteobacteria bacterium]|nr:hypothetical protein [Deltaproteobacteria bacterium]